MPPPSTSKRNQAVRPASAKASAPISGKPSTRANADKRAHILAIALQQFARFGFEGVSVDQIAQAVGMSRHNLFYYYPSKEVLYEAVIASVIDPWLVGMGDLSRGEDPRVAIRAYLQAKMQSTQHCPDGARLFAQEIMSGATRIKKILNVRVKPLLAEDVACFERWAREGKIAPVNFTHLMFIIWSVTQAYAELEPQFALLLGRKRLQDQDYATASELIERMVLAALDASASH